MSIALGYCWFLLAPLELMFALVSLFIKALVGCICHVLAKWNTCGFHHEECYADDRLCSDWYIHSLGRNSPDADEQAESGGIQTAVYSFQLYLFMFKQKLLSHTIMIYPYLLNHDGELVNEPIDIDCMFGVAPMQLASASEPVSLWVTIKFWELDNLISNFK